MKFKKPIFAAPGLVLALLTSILFATSCSKPATPKAQTPTVVAKPTAPEESSLSREQIENVVRRSYQYVAMYNVIQKFALDPASGGMFMDGFNRPVALTVLADHTMKSIARPNNDTLYQGAVLDLRHDPVIIEFPAIDSKYVCLETSGYAHYVGVPLATSEGDFKEPTKLLFYTDRTKGYRGQPVEGVDRIVKADGDFLVAFLRAMPHQADPARMAGIIQALKDVKVVTLSEFQGKPAKDSSDAKFPAYGKTDGDVFATNLLEVMQFVFNHTTFDPNNAMDQAVLAAYKPLGVEPGKPFDATKVAKLDGAMFREVAAEVAKHALEDNMTDPVVLARVTPQMFMPKGQIDLEAQVTQSVLGPIGLPAYQARYIPAATKDGKPMSAQHDYVLKMSKNELPPATAFWSLTLYDLENGFFIPNDHKKYSVGENAGFKLNADGGIEIYVSATKPEGVPDENWLPINREDIGLNGMFRIYSPDVEEMKTWKTPQFEKLLTVNNAKSGNSNAPTANSNRYMGAPVTLVKAPNGAIINKDVLDQLPKTGWTKGPEIEKPAKGVYVLGGYLISACIVVEAEEGLIVFDTGDTKKDGKKLLQAIRTFSQKPIKAIVYGHSHYCFGAGVMAEGNKDVMVIGHPDLNKIVAENMTGGGAPAFYPEIGPLLTSRALQQFNQFLPDKGPDAWFSPTNLSVGELDFLPVNNAVKDGEVLDVLGIKMQFFTRYGTDDKAHTTVWLPDRKICIENALWSTPPNLYSIRGDLYRDPREWYQCVKVVRDLEPEVLVGYAHRPIIGKEKVLKTLTNYMDGISFVLDQSLRLIIGGYGPEDLRHMIKMPDYLAADPHNFESYGELSFQSPAIFYFAVGWYNGDAATIFRPSPKEEAERLVKLIGGRDKVLAEAKAAMEKKEYAWAAQLVNYVYRLNPQDKEARLLKAEILRQLAYLSTGANARSHLLTAALALESKVTVPRLIPPNPRIIEAKPATFVDYFRIRLDPQKSGATDKVIQFNFKGDHQPVALHVRRAVAEFVSDPGDHYKTADVELTLSGETWAKLYLSSESAEKLIKDGEIDVKKGAANEAAELFALFDKYRPEKAVLVRPHLHD
jgi:alkyl sulfatase BDS1-like metallo-beta-lactamase superfamily hydrolase